MDGMFPQTAKTFIALLLTLQGLVFAIEDDTVLVKLRGVAVPKGKLVTIDDVAQITGGDLVTRREIGQLDLALIEHETVNSLSKRQIRLRIQLAGLAGEHVKVVGDDKVLLRPPLSSSNPQRLLDTLRPKVADRLGVSPTDVRLRLSRPLAEDAEILEPGVQLEFFIPAAVRVGPLTVRAGIYEHGRLRQTVPISLDLQVAQAVTVTTRTIESGETITSADIATERRVLSREIARHAATNVVGEIAKKSILKGAVVSSLDLAASASSAKPIVVRNRDIVEIVARRNSLRVTISGGMALQQGAVGDAIRVKNPSSGKVLTAMVVDEGTVEIRL